MNGEVYHFYKRTIRPKDYEVYFHHNGIVGYKKELKGKQLFFKGTEMELLKYYRNLKIPRKVNSNGALINY